MTVAANSLGLVQSELFVALETIETALGQFIAEKNPELLEQVRENLQQVRGTLRLIEFSSADFLLQEIDRLLTTCVQSPDNRLPALLSSLHALRRHLECNEGACRQYSEFLLPVINALRKAHDENPLPESFFFRCKLAAPRPQVAPALLDNQSRNLMARRLRQMYQVGLLGILREQNAQASIKLMARAFERLDKLFAASRGDKLFWVGAAVLESLENGGLLLRKERRKLFSQLDRELRQRLQNPEHESPKELYKELLYLLALSTSEDLREHRQLLLRPDRSVMQSLTQAVREELISIQEIVDLIGRGSHGEESLTSLKIQLGLLANTLAMIDLPAASTSLKQQIPRVEQWTRSAQVPTAELGKLADTLLLTENLLSRLERGETQLAKEDAVDEQFQAFIRQQLAEARIAAIDEARIGLVQARKALMNWIEADGDKIHLAEVPEGLATVCGGLWFLGQTRTLQLVQGCRDYIKEHILNAEKMPAEQHLEVLADALTSLEYYLESGSALQQNGSQSEALLLATQSLNSLGVAVAPGRCCCGLSNAHLAQRPAVRS